MLCRMKTNYGVSFDSHIQWKENSILITSDPILKAFWTLQEQGLGTLITFEMTLTPSAIGQAFLLRKGIPWLAPSILQAFLEKATLSHV